MYNNSNFVFVSFEPGSRGHNIGRVLCSLPEVYWYSSLDNGINPWNISQKSDWLIQRQVAPKHFDRTMPNGEALPPAWDYVKDFVDRHILSRLISSTVQKSTGSTISKYISVTVLYTWIAHGYISTVPQQSCD